MRHLADDLRRAGRLVAEIQDLAYGERGRRGGRGERVRELHEEVVAVCVRCCEESSWRRRRVTLQTRAERAADACCECCRRVLQTRAVSAADACCECRRCRAASRNASARFLSPVWTARGFAPRRHATASSTTAKTSRASAAPRRRGWRNGGRHRRLEPRGRPPVATRTPPRARRPAWIDSQSGSRARRRSPSRRRRRPREARERPVGKNNTVTLRRTDPSLALGITLARDEGDVLYIRAMASGSLGAESGALRCGDVVVAVNGAPPPPPPPAVPPSHVGDVVLTLGGATLTMKALPAGPTRQACARCCRPKARRRCASATASHPRRALRVRRDV